jgi:hypothetical protein
MTALSIQVFVPIALLAGVCFSVFLLLKRNRSARIAAVAIALATLVAGTAGYQWLKAESREGHASNARVASHRDLVERVLLQNLVIGDSSEDIESFLRQRGISFRRESGAMSGYYFLLSTEQEDTWIQVGIRTDDRMRLKKVSVDSYWAGS